MVLSSGTSTSSNKRVNNPHTQATAIANNDKFIRQASRPGIVVRFTAGTSDCSLLGNDQTGSGAYPPTYIIEIASMKMIAHLHLKLRLRIRGSIPPLSHTPSRHDSYPNKRTTLPYFTTFIASNKEPFINH
jgi:hypothetical protein